MEWKIGEIFEYDNKWYQCVTSINYTCKECDLHLQCKASELEFPFGVCLESERRDNTQVVFKKLEKVGKPTLINGKRVQLIKAVEPYTSCYNCCFYHERRCLIPKVDHESNAFYIEIKQNKEDMEQEIEYIRDENNNKEDMSKYCRRKIGMEEMTLDEAIKHCEDIVAKCENKDSQCALDHTQLHDWLMELKQYKEKKLSNPENIRKDLKPFNLEAAKAGKPICTRDGRKARIICFDKRGDYPLVVLIEGDGGEWIENYEVDGLYNYNGEKHNLDLMMLPEKKDGWVNVYASKDYIFQSEEEAKAHNNDFENYITTIKITLLE